MQKQIKIGNSVYPVSSDDNYLDAMGNDFEPHMVQLFRALVSPDDVVADIGANIGLTAILFSSLAKRAYAFEPSPSTFRILSENLDRNGVSNVDAINLGMGGKEETLTITFAQDNRSGGYVSDKIRPETGHVTEDICIDTLDRFFDAREPAPTFLKIDVEGFEQNVVQGGAEFLQRARPVVVMEMNHFCLDVLQRITIPDFLDFMRSIFPYLYAIDADNKTIVDLHLMDQAYMVMHEHVVKHRFPNLVGGFDSGLKQKLGELERIASEAAIQSKAKMDFKTPALSMPKGKMTVRASGSDIKAGTLFELLVRIANESQETWYGYGENPVYLSYHWENANGDPLIFDGLRTELIEPELPPAGTAQQYISVTPPKLPGKYKLVATMVQEGVCWFEDKGFEPVVLDIEVS
jgi:FkbM family methyltransferase